MSHGFLLSLRFEQPIDCFLRFAGCREYGSFVMPEDRQPVSNVRRVIGSWLRIQLEFGTDKGTTKFRDQLLSRIRF